MNQNLDIESMCDQCCQLDLTCAGSSQEPRCKGFTAAAQGNANLLAQIAVLEAENRELKKALASSVATQGQLAFVVVLKIQELKQQGAIVPERHLKEGFWLEWAKQQAKE